MKSHNKGPGQDCYENHVGLSDTNTTQSMDSHRFVGVFLACWENRFLCRVSFGERVLSRLFLKADGNAATTNGEARDIDEPGCHGGNEHILCTAHRRSGHSRISWRMPNCILG